MAVAPPGRPGRLSHAWQDFKHPQAAALSQDTLARFGTVSGNGRYDYWKAAVDVHAGPLLRAGPGTFQLLWLPRAPYSSYVQNAHSLYFETLAEVGLVGLALLVGVLRARARRRGRRSRSRARDEAGRGPPA